MRCVNGCATEHLAQSYLVPVLTCRQSMLLNELVKLSPDIINSVPEALGPPAERE